MSRVAHFGRALALAVAVAGCAGNPTLDPFSRGGGRPIRVDILNRNFADATIWAVYPAERIRLGTVTGKTESSFRLPWRGFSEPVQMEIDLVGGGRCITEQLMVDEGDVLYLEIELELAAMRECR